MAMIDAEALFQSIIQAKKRFETRLDFTYRSIGEAALAGKEISEYDRGTVREDKGRIAQLEWVIEEMQRIAREAEK